jgi:hypothetical protein
MRKNSRNILLIDEEYSRKIPELRARMFIGDADSWKESD